MNAAQFGYMLGAFLMSLLFAALWLIFCRMVPALRRDPSASYGVALALAVAPLILSTFAAGLNPFAVAGTGACLALLWWQRRRAVRKRHAIQVNAGNA